MKKCTKCEEPKKSSEFRKDKRHKDGLQSQCKICQKKAHKEWRKNNRLYFINYRKTDNCNEAQKKHRSTEKYKINYKKYISLYGKTTRGRLFKRWSNMKTRCYNTKSKDYKDYGGRGISVCEEWLESSEHFIKWSINNGFKEELQIDRINNDSNYSPKNCRWVTAKQNARNKGNAVTDFINKTRICCKCLKVKKITDFHRSKKEPLGRIYKCKECSNK